MSPHKIKLILEEFGVDTRGVLIRGGSLIFDEHDIEIIGYSSSGMHVLHCGKRLVNHCGKNNRLKHRETLKKVAEVYLTQESDTADEVSSID